jgi:hypothetical protein
MLVTRTHKHVEVAVLSDDEVGLSANCAIYKLVIIRITTDQPKIGRWGRTI